MIVLIMADVQLLISPDPHVAIMADLSKSTAAPLNTSRMASVDFICFVTGSISSVNGRLTDPLICPGFTSSSKT